MHEWAGAFHLSVGLGFPMNKAICCDAGARWMGIGQETYPTLSGQSIYLSYLSFNQSIMHACMHSAPLYGTYLQCQVPRYARFVHVGDHFFFPLLSLRNRPPARP